MPRPPASRSDAESRYRDLRRMAFQQAQAVLAADGIAAELRPIDAVALAAFATWPPRSVDWPWPKMAADWRRGRPARFDLAIWSDDTLCGLALGRPAPSAAHMSLHYLEGNPDPGHPLHFKVLNVVITALEAYATVLGKTELRLVDPLPEAVSPIARPCWGLNL
jgi:hypothetical protein